MKKLLVLFLLVFTAITVSAQKSSNIVFDYDYCYNGNGFFDCEGTIYFGYEDDSSIIALVSSGQSFVYKIDSVKKGEFNDGDKYIEIKVKQIAGSNEYEYFVLPYKLSAGVVFRNEKNEFIGFKSSKYD